MTGMQPADITTTTSSGTGRAGGGGEGWGERGPLCHGIAFNNVLLWSALKWSSSWTSHGLCRSSANSQWCPGKAWREIIGKS